MSSSDRRRRFPAALALALALGGCGFQPLYGRGSASAEATQALGQVYVPPIEGRIGLDLRNNLIERLGWSAENAGQPYRLDIRLRSESDGLAIEQDDSVTRYNYRLFADYRLIDASSGEVALRGEAREVAAYNVVDSEFATLSAQRDVEERAAREIAQTIKTRLALHFGATAQ